MTRKGGNLMSIHSIPSFNSNEALIQSLMKVKDVNNEQEMMGVISSAMDSVSLSFLGKNFASYYDTLRSEGNQEALEGLRQMAIHMIDNPNNTTAMNFVNIMSSRDNDDGFLNEFFSTVNQIGETGNQLGNWINTFTSLESSSNQDGFIRTTQNILSSEGSSEEIREAFSDFVQTTDQIVSRYDDQDRRSESLDNFFSHLRDFETLEDFALGLGHFRDNMG